MGTKQRVAPKNRVGAILEQSPRWAAQARKAEYLGPCIVQDRGAWTRCGPTWRTPQGIWITIGPGVARWGTTAGLAQLAVETTPAPTWHAVGLSFSPSESTNIGFAVSEGALDAKTMAEVRALTRDAEAWIAGQDQEP